MAFPDSDGDFPLLRSRFLVLSLLAAQVTYSVCGFVERNSDVLHKELSNVMYQSENALLMALFPEGNPKRTQLKRPATLATQFKISIGALLKNIQSKQANFIACIKPNELKEPNLFELGLVQHQARYLLLAECARLRRSGFAFRQDYDAFLARYKMISPSTWPVWPGLPVEGVTHLLKDLPLYAPEYAFGRTKLFVRSLRTVSGQLAPRPLIPAPCSTCQSPCPASCSSCIACARHESRNAFPSFASRAELASDSSPLLLVAAIRESMRAERRT